MSGGTGDLVMIAVQKGSAQGDLPLGPREVAEELAKLE
jgi:hypothetical protein